MQTILKSRDLWDIVNIGITTSEVLEAPRLKEKEIQDISALQLIQPAVTDAMFRKIASATTSKQTWKALKREYARNEKIKTIKLQSLKREFERLKNETWRKY